MPDYTPDPEPIPSPKRPGWTAQFLDKEKVWAEKEYEKYVSFTPAQRILFGEELRVSYYGKERINARLQGFFEVLERKAS